VQRHSFSPGACPAALIRIQPKNKIVMRVFPYF
jgi:hypothetical protein